MSNEITSSYLGKPIYLPGPLPISAEEAGLRSNFGEGLSEEARGDIEVIEENRRNSSYRTRNFILD